MNLKQRILKAYKRGGILRIFTKFVEVSFRETRNVLLFFFLNIKPKKHFIFSGKSFKYFYHIYNTTWENERAVEIPIALNFINKYKEKKILEVGNTLNHYFPFSHDIIDKYEIGAGVKNDDVVDFKPEKKYDLIISVSTMEHVGWDEEVKDKEKILKAFLNLKEFCLAPGGIIFVTMPLGYNTFLDELLKNNKIPFTRKYFLKRISKNNEWKQIEPTENIESIKYGSPFQNANGIVLGIIN